MYTKLDSHRNSAANNRNMIKDRKLQKNVKMKTVIVMTMML